MSSFFDRLEFRKRWVPENQSMNWLLTYPANFIMIEIIIMNAPLLAARHVILMSKNSNYFQFVFNEAVHHFIVVVTQMDSVFYILNFQVFLDYFYIRIFIILIAKIKINIELLFLRYCIFISELIFLTSDPILNKLNIFLRDPWIIWKMNGT